MENPFAWVKFYPALADKIATCATDRATLLDWLLTELPDYTHYLHNRDGSAITDIDPFTVFGVFNRHIKDEARSQIASAFAKHFDLSEAVPKDFAGIPLLSNENSMFFPVGRADTEKDIQNLWDFYLLLLKSSAQLPEAFDRLAGHQYNVRFNLTIGMYWVRPNEFFPLDTPSRALLLEHGIEVSQSVPSFEHYRQICDQVTQLAQAGKMPGKTFAEITRYLHFQTHKA